ncbi:asparagine synthase (glutamine-hydrolyzing) [Magnetospirillum sp. UT-4]|uniref:asparagine synthase (glutamine-hydrolyzing) n=1 Tax=Magnetospirillum sp. UT-4 TaxID=2681467 RepID=UPI001381FC50|nr:asparagine synthase (glutamine-hydrolyzing) [Magnetospirillum sp. UT-4]CAA7615242.1 Asparagine synthase [Magnetospirillum sp. UT-4]
MCGIAGWVDSSAAAVGPGVIMAMTAAIAHRGPDGWGRWDGVSGNGRWRLSLGHRRLAIIDPAGGAQPMVSNDGRAILVFNGEIYNFAELRSELELLGRQFRTRSDTEVLLEAYQAWGIECVSRFRGMFAFALWDRVRERLFLARDRFGKKPLFLWRDDSGALAFASEIKALLAHPRVPARLDRASVAECLAWRYVPGPHTLFDGIVKLPPGCWACWEGGRLVQVSYWSPPDAGYSPGTHGGDAVAAFSRLLEECVALRMVSDVPFGAFLSGGIDSSAVVALMSRQSGRPVETFSVGYQEAGYSELAYARMVSKAFSTRHHELTIAAEDVITALPDLTRFRDAPVAEPADVPIHRLACEARRSVKMVLTGEGSDEVLGGYPKHRAEPWGALYRRACPPGLHRRLVEPLAAALPYRHHRAKTALHCFGLADPRQRLPRWFGAFSGDEVAALLALPVPPRAIDPRPFTVARRHSPMRAALAFDQASWLPDNLLERGDRMTMAAGIEARMPFMDHVLAHFLAKLPDRTRVGGRSGKRLLRLAMAGILPPEVLHRPKVGFRVPVADWFRDSLQGWVHELLLGPDSATRDWYRRDALVRLVEEHRVGRHNHEKALWLLITLEHFQRAYRLG